MKGSDKWGQGSGPRVEIVVAVLLAITLLGVAFYYFESSGLTSAGQGVGAATISTKGILCSSDTMPRAAQMAERDPNFIGLSKGQCYNFLGESIPAGGDGSTLTFVHYNGTITYPCGTSPEEVPDSAIQVVVTTSGSVLSAKLVAPSGTHQPRSCDPSIPVWVVAVDDVQSTIPAVPQLNLTLASPGGGRPITGLRAVLILDGGAQAFQFRSVTSTRPLAPESNISITEIVLSGVSFSSSEIYPMTISGTFDNGQSFSYNVHIQIAHVP